MPKQAATNSTVTVDTDEADPKKAVSRSDEDRESTWLDKSRAVQNRMARYAKNLEGSLKRQYDQQRAEDDAKWQRELRKRDDEIAALKRGVESAGSDAEHEAAIAQLQEQLTAAQETGDSKKVSELLTKITRLESQYQQKKMAAAMGTRVDQEREPERREAAKPAQQQQSNVANKARRYIDATEWWDDPEYAAERGAANAIYAQLVEAGSDPETDEHYERMNKRLRKKFPNLKLTAPDDLYGGGLDDDDDAGDEEVEIKAPQPRRKQANGVPSFRDQGNPSGRRPSRIRLEQSDLDMLSDMGYDPNSEEAQIALANARANRIATEA